MSQGPGGARYAAAGDGIPAPPPVCDCHYVDLVDLIQQNEIDVVFHCGSAWKFPGHASEDCTPMRQVLRRAGVHVTGLIFANCLVLLPTDVAVQNLEYLKPTAVPRTHVLTTHRGTVVHDLRLIAGYSDTLGDGLWSGVNLTAAAADMWNVVVNHEPPSQNAMPLWSFLMLRTGGTYCWCALSGGNWHCRNPLCRGP